MSNFTNFLNNPTANLVIDTNDIINFDIVNRTIVSNNINDIVVQDDNISRSIRYTIQKTFEDEDFSNKSIAINYINANNEKDVFFVYNKTIVGDSITFVWEISDHVTYVAGDVIYNIEFYNNTGYRWFTKPSSITVEKGLNKTTLLAKPSTDWIVSWRREAAKTLENCTASEQRIKDLIATIGTSNGEAAKSATAAKNSQTFAKASEDNSKTAALSAQSFATTANEKAALSETHASSAKLNADIAIAKAGEVATSATEVAATSVTVSNNATVATASATASEVSAKAAKTEADRAKIEADRVDITAQLNSHNASLTAHTDIRQLIANINPATNEALAKEIADRTVGDTTLTNSKADGLSFLENKLQLTANGALIGAPITITASSPSGSVGLYDVIIKTQAEFDALVASPTWLDAKSVCFVGSGKSLEVATPQADFTASQRILVPLTVKQIQGVNSPIIGGYTIGDGGSFFAYSKYLTPEYSIDSISVLLSVTNKTGQLSGFEYCTNMSNCGCVVRRSGRSSSMGDGGIAAAFRHCTNLTSCFGKCEMLSTSYTANLNPVIVFDSCEKLVNCTAIGSARDNVYGIAGCKYVANCTVDVLVVSNNEMCTAPSAKGIRGGSHIVNCYSKAINNCTSKNCNAYSFSDNYGLNNCSFTAKCVTGDTNRSYGVFNGNWVSNIRAYETGYTVFLGGANTHVDTETVGA